MAGVLYSGLWLGRKLYLNLFPGHKNTSIAIIAYGSTLPKYVINYGVSFSPPNTKKGKNLNNIVTKAITTIIKAIEKSFIPLLLSPASHYGNSSRNTNHGRYQKFIRTEDNKASG